MTVQPASRTPQQPPALNEEPPGLVLYVGLNPEGKESGTTLLELMDMLQEFAHEIAPQSRTMSALVTRSDSPTAEAIAAVRRALAQGATPATKRHSGGRTEQVTRSKNLA